VEGLEDRRVLSVAAPVGPAHAGPLVAGPAAPHGPAAVPLTFTGVAVQNGALVAQGLIGANPFSTAITLTTGSASPAVGSAAGPAATTPILTLHLAPIDLNLLGLEVKTSEICLNITATSGPGNLLGNLLTDVAGLLNGGTPLGNILGGLTGGQLNTLTNGLTGLLNGVAGALTSPAAAGATAAPAGGVTNILHLSLGPVNLNLLGLNVALNNCANPAGPVTVDVNAISGSGDLLGNLLTDVANLLNGPGLSTATVDAALTRIADNLLAII
jgi:hypothetical protein